jgi:hypothetical protein
MPTAGRLVGAILFAPLFWYVSTLILPLFLEGTEPPWYAELNALIGLLMGWIVAGSRAGDGYRAAIGYGVTTVFAVAFWSLFSHSFIEMIERSLDKRYKGPVEAVISIFELAIEQAQILAVPHVLWTAFIGGIIAALLTEYVGQRYP